MPYGFWGNLIFELVKKRVPVKKIPLWYFLASALGAGGFTAVLFLLIVLFNGGSEVPIGPYILLALGLGAVVGLVCGWVDWLIWIRKDYKKLKAEEGV